MGTIFFSTKDQHTKRKQQVKKGEPHKKGLIRANRHAYKTNEIENPNENDQLSTQVVVFFSINACPAIMLLMMSCSGVYLKDNSFSILLRS